MRRGGGRIQLVYRGQEDNFLTGNPKVSFFRFVYRRYTNFAMESSRLYFNGKADFGQLITCNVPVFGDLLGSMFLIIDLPKFYLEDGTEVPYTNAVAQVLIEEIKVMVGETEVDKQSGMWMNIWGALTTPAEQRLGYQEMIGEIEGNPAVGFQGPRRFYVPLQFWFNRSPGLYLPLLALQYHQVQIRLKLRPAEELFYTDDLTTNACTKKLKPVELPNIELWGDYIYLDNDERRRFVSNQHEYLIEQLQIVPPYAIKDKIPQISMPLVLNNPIKEIIFVFRRNIMEVWNEWYNFSSLGVAETGFRRDLLVNAKIQLDGQDRFEARSAAYFRLVQPYQYHTYNTSPRYIYLYSFALRPEEFQPSGTLNASRFDSIQIQAEVDSEPIYPESYVSPTGTQTRGNMTCFAFATTYNIFKIVDGYGGIMFAN